MHVVPTRRASMEMRRRNTAGMVGQQKWDTIIFKHVTSLDGLKTWKISSDLKKETANVLFECLIFKIYIVFKYHVKWIVR